METSTGVCDVHGRDRGVPECTWEECMSHRNSCKEEVGVSEEDVVCVCVGCSGRENSMSYVEA